uniref:Aspartokinase 1, chloroplastic n=1 Tax=Aegilops tauschii TaxID=37682 RepID=M8BLT8_AEGTA
MLCAEGPGVPLPERGGRVGGHSQEGRGGGWGRAAAGFTVVMKFGGSSVLSAARMREVADLILSFPEETPVVVLSAMGKTTNNLLLVLPPPFSTP